MSSYFGVRSPPARASVYFWKHRIKWAEKQHRLGCLGGVQTRLTPSSAVCGKFFVSRPGTGTCFRLPHQTPTLKWGEWKNRGFHFFTESHGSRFHPRSPKTLIFSVFLTPLMAPKLISQAPISVNSGSPDWGEGREILEIPNQPRALAFSTS